MFKALARGFRWRKLLETDVYGAIEEIAAKEQINSSYVGRLLRMTLLAPDIVEAIMDGRQPAQMTLAVLMAPIAALWTEQNCHVTPPLMILMVSLITYDNFRLYHDEETPSDTRSP